MEIILRKDVLKLGFKDDIVTVKNGYGLNYLIPQGFASLATASAKKQLEDILKQRSFKEQKLIEASKATADKIKALKIAIKVKTGESNKMFGSVTNSRVASALSKQGIDIDSKFIKVIGGTIKSLGSYIATIRLHRDLSVDLKFKVVEEKSKKNKSK